MLLKTQHKYINKVGLGYNRIENEHRKKNSTLVFPLHTKKSINILVKLFSVKNSTNLKTPAPIKFKVVHKIYEHSAHLSRIQILRKISQRVPYNKYKQICVPKKLLELIRSRDLDIF